MGKFEPGARLTPSCRFQRKGRRQQDQFSSFSGGDAGADWEVPGCCIAQYSLIIGPSAKVVDIELLNPDATLSELADAVRASSMPQLFPDDTIEKLPRVGNFVCLSPDQPCTFTLPSATAGSRVSE
jgi:hypothetical protein